MRRVAAGAALALAGIFWAAPALGDATITAGPLPNTYANKEVTIDQGQSITFQNSDTTAFHDVTADQNGADGKALFQSETIAGGKSSPVKGVEFLTTGDYTFHCSVHPNIMMGTIHITANGTPKPRTPDNPAPSPSDKTPPDARVAILDATIAKVLQHRGLRVRLGTDEPARFSLAASAGKTKVATGIATSKGAKTVKLGLTRKGRSLLRHAKTVKLRLTAKVNDAADNKSSATATRTLR